jgi:hypothetical protein
MVPVPRLVRRTVFTGTEPSLKIEIYKSIEFKKKIQHMPYIFADTQHCWKIYITNSGCNLTFPVSEFFFKYQKKNSISYIEIFTNQWYASVKVSEPLP